MKRIDVIFSPALYSYYRDEESVVVIIDILRATTAICTAFEYGVRSVIPVATIDEARRYKEKGYMVGAEREGVRVPGFDFGNSPFDYMSDIISGKDVVLTTTNGTQAIEVARKAYKIVIGAFTNVEALVQWLLRENRSVQLLCAGWKNKFNLEDSLFAGAVVHELSHRTHFEDMSDSALCCMYLYQMAYKDPYRFLSHSSHKKRLAALGLKQDIKYALSINQTKKVPYFDGEKIVAL